MKDIGHPFEKTPTFEEASTQSEEACERQPELTEEDKKIQCNIDRMEVILKKAREFVSFFDYKHPREKPGINVLRHQKEAFYPKYEWDRIQGVFNRLRPTLADLAEDPGIKFHALNHLDHLLGNSPFGKLSYADRTARKLTKEGGDIRKSEQHFLEEKETMDLLLFYIDMLENNPEIMRGELESEEGWLDGFRELYSKETQDGRIILAHINFFARLSKFDMPRLNISGLDKISAPIVADNFEEVFNKLPGKEFLDKEKIKNKFFPNQAETIESQAA